MEITLNKNINSVVCDQLKWYNCNNTDFCLKENIGHVSLVIQESSDIYSHLESQVNTLLCVSQRVPEEYIMMRKFSVSGFYNV